MIGGILIGIAVVSFLFYFVYKGYYDDEYDGPLE